MTVVTLPVMILRMQGAAQGQLAAMVDSLRVPARRRDADPLLRGGHEGAAPGLGFAGCAGSRSSRSSASGLAVNNARGVLEAFTGLRTEFVRTPKLGVLGDDKKLVKRRERTYTGGRDFWQAVIEIALGVFYVYMGAVQWSLVGVGAIVTLVLSLGLFMTGGATLRALWLKSQARRDRQVTADAAAKSRRRSAARTWPPRL